ncbi:VOC family protein [Streptomyces sp. NPDC089919]|uniref:VOC family protein n=1 Tax=Streptomyces sp. NPDC089919 TaxID=3155188 RepID=UPI00343B3910
MHQSNAIPEGPDAPIGAGVPERQSGVSERQDGVSVGAGVPQGLDHIVYATPSLEDTVAEFARRTGVHPAPGGSHPGLGTRNHVVGLGGSAYLEIIGPDRGQPAPDHPRPFGIDGLREPVVATWVLRPPDLDEAAARLRALGHDPGPVRTMSRTAPDGTTLSWRLTDPAAAGLLPFLIDWGTTPHPTTAPLPQTPLTSLTLHSPTPPTPLLASLNTHPTLQPGPTRLTFTVTTPRGAVTFG